MASAIITQPTQSRLLRVREVLHLTGLSRSALYRYIADGCFPCQVKIGALSSAWVEAEVEAWIVARIAANRGKRTA